MKKLISVAIVLVVLMLLAPTPALADEPCPYHRIWVYPATQTVEPGHTFTVTLMQDSPGGTTFAGVDFHFDHTLLEILSVEAGAAYEGALLVPLNMPAAIAEANLDGSLDDVATFFWLYNAPPGEQEFLVITMKAKEGIVGVHRVDLKIYDLAMVPVGEPLLVPTGTHGEVIVEGPQPDLIVPEVTTDWVVVGHTYTVGFTIENIGDYEAAASTAHIYVDGAREATAAVPALAGGKSHEVATDVITLTDACDTIKVYADGGRVVTEADEGNNTREKTLADVLPDLIVPAVATEWKEGYVGEKYYVTFTIKNRGDGLAEPSTAHIYVDGAREATAAVPALAGGKSHEVTTEAFTLTAAYDTIKVYADDGRVVTEADERNNCKEITIVPPEPDLVVSDISTECVEGKEGEKYYVTFTIENIGGAKAAESIASIIIDGVERATAEVPELVAGGTYAVVDAGPFTLIGVTDTVKVLADRDDAVVEFSEVNNYREVILEGPHKVKVTAEVPAAYVAIRVPASLKIPVVRGQLNTVACLVQIVSNARWQLQVRDAKTDGYMLRVDDPLEHPMQVAHANITVCLTEGGVVADGAGSQMVNTQLRQQVEYGDAAGEYTITVTFTVFPVW